jgi:hypothetical protein
LSAFSVTAATGCHEGLYLVRRTSTRPFPASIFTIFR